VIEESEGGGLGPLGAVVPWQKKIAYLLVNMYWYIINSPAGYS
jgi:hypothetical protein